MKLIDVRWFQSGPLQIENADPLEDANNNADAVIDMVEAYIKRLTPKFLHLLLGDDLAQLILRRLEDCEYGYDDDMADAVIHRIQPAFAHYVFYHILRDASEVATITGLVRLSNANDYAAPRERMCIVWNEMVELNRAFVRWAATDECSYHVYYHRTLVTPINLLNL